MTSTDLKTSDISIIIPTLNEADNIPPLAANLKKGGWERIIVDGGSTDATVSIAQEHGFKVIQAAPGRAAQLNRGAAEAKGKVLLFLHADTRMPENFAPVMLDAITRDICIVGAFHLAIEGPSPALRIIAACANLRSRLFQLPYGDQAIFMKKDAFDCLQGYPDLPIMEDYVFIKKAAKKGRIVLLPEKVTTSARRWKRLGVCKTTIINQLVILGFFLKIPPERLALFYRS